MPATFQFTLSRYTHDALVVDDTSVVLEEGSILASNIYQHRRETIGTTSVYRCPVWVRSVLSPQARFGTPCIPVAGTARITGIDGSQSVARVQGIVIEAVTMRKPFLVGRNTGHPVGICVVGIAGVLEDRRGACRKHETFWHLYVSDVVYL